MSTGLSTKWATKVVYDACKIQIGQPCLPALLLNTLLLDSALIHFSCPDSSPLSKHLTGTLVILSSWSISQKCKIRICSGQISVSVFIPLPSFHMQAAVGVSDVMIARELTAPTQQIFRSFSPFYQKKDN